MGGMWDHLAGGKRWRRSAAELRREHRAGRIFRWRGTACTEASPNVKKPSTPEVLQVIQKGWRVGRARRWRTGRLASLTVRHRILPTGDGEVRKVTLPLKKRNKGPVQTSPLDGLVWQQYRRGTRTGQNWRQGNILKRVTLHKNPPKLGINY